MTGKILASVACALLLPSCGAPREGSAIGISIQPVVCRGSLAGISMTLHVGEGLRFDVPGESCELTNDGDMRCTSGTFPARADTGISAGTGTVHWDGRELHLGGVTNDAIDVVYRAPVERRGRLTCVSAARPPSSAP